MRLKKAMVWMVVVSLLFTAGCGTKDGDGKMAQGRFVEEVLSYPEEDAYVIAQVLNEDDTLGVYLLEKESGEIHLYHTKDGTSWDRKEMPWSLPAGEDFSGIARGPNGEVYLLTAAYTDDSVVNHVYQEEGGSLREIPMDWNGGNIPEYGIMTQGLEVLDNGDLLIGQSYEGVAQYGPDGSYKRIYEGARDTRTFAVSGNFLYLWDSSANAVQVYDGDTFEQVKSLSFEHYTTNTTFSSGQNGMIYLYNAKGLFRLMSEGSMFERIIDGELSSLSIPTEYFSGLVETSDGVFYLCGGDGVNSSRLYRYHYDETVAARPSEELTVYTLYENPLLNQAAAYFNQRYPEVKVNIQVGIGEGSASASEVIQALNTELLGGKGPDLLLLDGMNAENYIAKGVLAEITDLVAEISDQSPMIEPVVNTLASKGKLYAVPTRFLLPVYYTAEEHLAEIKDFDSLVAFAQNHPEKGIIGNKTGKGLMEAFMAANGQNWISKEGIDEVKLKRCLEGIKAMADTGAEAFLPETDDRSVRTGSASGAVSTEHWKTDADEFFHWAYGRSHGVADVLTGFSSFTVGCLAMEKVGSGAVTHLPGSAAKAFIPADIAAINANTQKKEQAENFIKLMFSSDLQQVDLRQGFPVNIEGLNQSMVERDDVMFGMSDQSRPEEELVGGMPSIRAQEKIRDLCLAVETPYTLDTVLTEMILDEAEGYFTGQKTADQAVKDIKERTRIYLSE